MNIIINPYIFKNAPATTLLNGLLACWEMNETSGTTVVDECGVYNGTNLGATINQTGKLNKAYLITAANQYTDVGAPVVNGLSSISFSMWLYPTRRTSTSNRYYPLLGKNRPTYINNHIYLFTVEVIARYGYYEFTLGDGSDYYRTQSGVGTYVLNQWIHVSGTWDGSIQKLYLNGVLEDSISNTMSAIESTSDNIRIGDLGGGRYSGLVPYFGLIDQTAIWNRVLTQQEISDLYNNGNGRAYSEF